MNLGYSGDCCAGAGAEVEVGVVAGVRVVQADEQDGLVLVLHVRH